MAKLNICSSIGLSMFYCSFHRAIPREKTPEEKAGRGAFQKNNHKRWSYLPYCRCSSEKFSFATKWELPMRGVSDNQKDIDLHWAPDWLVDLDTERIEREDIVVSSEVISEASQLKKKKKASYLIPSSSGKRKRTLTFCRVQQLSHQFYRRIGRS